MSHSLSRDKFGTYGKNGVDGKGAGGGWADKKKHKPLDKVWVFAGHHRVTPIKQRKFSALENARKKHSLVSALTSDHYVERELVIFYSLSQSYPSLRMYPAVLAPGMPVGHIAHGAS